MVHLKAGQPVADFIKHDTVKEHSFCPDRLLDNHHGPHLATPKFLVLWSIVVLDAIIFYVVSPFCIWIEKSLDRSENSPKLSATARGSGIRLKTEERKLCSIRDSQEFADDIEYEKANFLLECCDFVNFVDHKYYVRGHWIDRACREISGNPYYLDFKTCDYCSVCGTECQELSRSIFMAVVALSGIQATVAFVIPLCSVFSVSSQGKQTHSCVTGENVETFTTDNQRRILEYLFASGTRNPCLEEIERITADLQGHGHASRLPSVLKAPNWTSLFRSKRSSEKSYAQEEEDRRYSSVDPSDVRTLELFPLHPAYKSGKW
ncbi:hypothetical protein SUGI_0486880 [Cryptomeria japonica]|nr:hypothetical protein SUGI_0486880 [Cryptomeria japonica]